MRFLLASLRLVLPAFYFFSSFFLNRFLLLLAFASFLFRCLSLVTHEGVKCTCFTFVVFSFPFISHVRVCVCICVCVQIINLAGSRPLVVHSLDSSCSPIPAFLRTVSSSDEETHYRSLFSHPSFSSERAWSFFPSSLLVIDKKWSRRDDDRCIASSRDDEAIFFSSLLHVLVCSTTWTRRERYDLLFSFLFFPDVRLFDYVVNFSSSI